MRDELKTKLLLPLALPACLCTIIIGEYFLSNSKIDLTYLSQQNIQEKLSSPSYSAEAIKQDAINYIKKDEADNNLDNIVITQSFLITEKSNNFTQITSLEKLHLSLLLIFALYLSSQFIKIRHFENFSKIIALANHLTFTFLKCCFYNNRKIFANHHHFSSQYYYITIHQD